MLILPKAALDRLIEATVSAARNIVDQDGQRVTLGTFDPHQLRMAAINAVSTVAGQVVWPQDQRIDLPKPVEPTGPFARSA